MLCSFIYQMGSRVATDWRAVTNSMVLRGWGFKVPGSRTQITLELQLPVSDPSLYVLVSSHRKTLLLNSSITFKGMYSKIPEPKMYMKITVSGHVIFLITVIFLE